MQAVLSYTKTYKLTRVRVSSMHPWLILMGQVLVLVVMLFALVQPAIAKDLKPELSLDDRAAIMKLADRIEVVFLEGRDKDLTAYVRPEHGLFIDLWGDQDPEGEGTVKIPYQAIGLIFNDYSKREWGPQEVGQGEVVIVSSIPYILLYGWHEYRVLTESDVEDDPGWGERLSLPEMMRRYDDKRIDGFAVEPTNHSLAYDGYHYVQYWLQANEMQGVFWFLIVDKDEHGWFLKGLVHMKRWVI